MMWYPHILFIFLNRTIQTVFQPIMRTDYPGTGCQKARVVTLEPSKELIQAMKETHTPETWGTMWSASNYIPVGSIFVRFGEEGRKREGDVSDSANIAEGLHHIVGQ